MLPLSLQRGFSIVETMIAVAIGLFLTAVIVQVYLASKQSFRDQDDDARLQENARYTLELLTREVRQAGYKGYGSEAEDESLLFPTAQPVIAGTNDANTLTNTAVSDQLTLRFYGSGSPADNSVVDCLGRPVAATLPATTATLTADTFSIAADPSNNNEPSLYCASTVNGITTTAAIARGIESLQILYGEDSDGDKVTNRFVPAGTVGLTMSNVISVRISLLFRTSQAINLANDTTVYNHFGIAYAPGAVAPAGDSGSVTDPTPDDRRLRRLFSTTISLRNRLN